MSISNIDKILAKIEFLLNETNYEPFTDEVFGRIQSLKELKSYIDSLQEEPVSKDFEMALAEMIDKAQKCVIEPWVVAAQWKDELIRLAKSEEPVSEDFEQALEVEWKGYVDRGVATVDALEDNTQELAFAKGFYKGAQWQKLKIIYKAIIYNDKIYPTTYEDAPTEFCLDGGEEVRLITEAVNNGLLKQGDKVKVIIIKDE